MGDTVVRIEKLENGWEVEYQDPGIQAENRKSKAVWRDPSKGYAFTDIKELLKFLEAKLPILAPAEDDDEYAQNFKAAVAETD